MKNKREDRDAYELWEESKRRNPKYQRRLRMCQELPYCLIKWDGREILYNRNYKPLWERGADGVVTSSTEKYGSSGFCVGDFRWIS